jgi:hypothetical protein
MQNPAGNRGVVHRQSTLRHHLLKVAIAQRVTRIPTYAEDNDLAPKMSSPEQHRLVLAHSFHPNRPTSTRLCDTSFAAITIYVLNDNLAFLPYR